MKVYYVDIDNTICTDADGKYNKAKPFPERIKKINKLYDEGHWIVIWTSRGRITGKDFIGLTKRQLERWKVKYHILSFDKPYYDHMHAKCKRACGSVWSLSAWQIRARRPILWAPCLVRRRCAIAAESTDTTCSSRQESPCLRSTSSSWVSMNSNP